MDPIYLDYNATTPIDPAVAQAMLPFIHQHFGNPSSGHIYGQRTRSAVDAARHQIATLLGCLDQEVIFTSGGTEANNYAIKGVVGASKRKGNHIITSAVEHPAVTEVCRFLEEQGCRVTYLPVDAYGLVDPQQVEAAITAQTVLVTIMHANNEVGTIEPVREIADIAHQHGIMVHSDCAQSIGKIPVTVDRLGVDLLSMAGHKLYAPKGIGVLYCRQGVTLEKLIHGANHEMNWRAGTENVVEIVGLGQACELILQHLPAHQEHLRQMRDRLEEGLKAHFPELRINGHPQQRLPNTCSVSFPGVEASTVLAQMSGVAASAGAACHSDQVEVSSVLEAMRVPLEFAMGTVRLSVGRYTTAADIDRAVAEIARAVDAYRPPGGRSMPSVDLANDAPATELFPQFESQILQMISEEVEGLTEEQLDFESDRWGWSKWSIRRNLSHLASGDVRWLVLRWGDQLFPEGPPEIEDLEGIVNSPYDRRLDETKYWSVPDIMAKLRLGLELSQSVLVRETVGSMQTKVTTNPRAGNWVQMYAAHPRGIRPHPDDPHQALVSLEATFRHRYFEYLTHLYNIQRLKRAQGLAARVEIPFEGYWALPDWDRSEP